MIPSGGTYCNVIEFSKESMLSVRERMSLTKLQNSWYKEVDPLDNFLRSIRPLL